MVGVHPLIVDSSVLDNMGKAAASRIVDPGFRAGRGKA
jgi:hypothetical protein